MSEWKASRSPMVSVGRENASGIPVSAVIADMGVVDLDGDTYDSGAFRPSGKCVISQWGHSALLDRSMPVGEGTITEKANMAIFNGVIFKEMQAGRDLAALLRRRGASQQWSYGFDVLDSRQDRRDGKSVRVLKSVNAFEVSPVTKGAGLNTATLSVGETAMKLRFVDQIAEFKRRHNEYWSSDRYHDNCDRCDDRDIEFAVLEKAQLTLMQLDLESWR